jgi:type I restriction enzyme S subunit
VKDTSLAPDSFPSHWERSTVGELYELSYGKGLVKKSRKEDGPYPVYGSNGVVGHHENYVAEGPVVIVGRKGAAGEVHFSPESCWPIDTTYFVKPKKAVDEKFTYYLLKSLRLKQFETSTAIPGLNRDDAYRLNIGVPPVQEQKDIVAKIETLFSELDKGIESLKTARQQLKAYRQAVLKHAFEGKLTEQWRQQNADELEPPEQLLSRIPQPDQPRGGRQASVEVIGGVAALAVNKPAKVPPGNWVWTPLLRVARQETGHTPSRKHPEYWDGDQYWIGIVDARHNHGQVIQETAQKVTLEGLHNSSARTLPEGTVCLSRTASVGYVCIMGKPMATSQDFATWTCTEALEPKFLMYALMAEGNEIRRFGKGTTHTTIYFPEIRALHICLPSVQEQKVIIEAVEAKLQQVSHAWNEIGSQLRKAETLRQSILKKAFSGQLVGDALNAY